MTAAEISLVVGGLTLATLTVLLPVILRLAGSLPPSLRMLGFAGGVHVAGTLIAAVVTPGFSYWHGAALYWFGFMGLVFFYSAFQKSISLEIVDRLAAAGPNGLSEDDVTQQVIQLRLTGRIALLVQSGLVEPVGDGYAITEAGRITAAKIRRAQRFFGLAAFSLYFKA